MTPRARRHASERELSAGGVVVRCLDGVRHVLLIRDPYGHWGLPKGHLERDEDPATAALREVREETGLESLELGSSLGTIDWYFRRGDALVHKYCTFYLMRSRDGDPSPQTTEGITECRWLPLDEAMRQISYENTKSVLREVARVLETSRLSE